MSILKHTAKAVVNSKVRHNPMTRERESREVQIEANRPERVPLHEQKRSVLNASNRDANYVYRFVNDVNNPDGSTRVDAFKLAGYEVVENTNTKIGDVDGNASLGTSAIANVGRGRKAILMRISKDMYDKDQKAKQAEITRQEQLMMRRKVNAKESGEDGTYGEVSLKK